MSEGMTTRSPATSYKVRFTFARMKEEGRKSFNCQGRLCISGDAVEVHGRISGPTIGDAAAMLGGAVGGAVGSLIDDARGSHKDKVFPVDLERTEAFFDESRRIFAFWTPYARWMLVKPKGAIFSGRSSRDVFNEAKRDLEEVLGEPMRPAEMNRLDPWRQLVQWICISILIVIVVLVTVLVILGMRGHFDRPGRSVGNRSSRPAVPVSHGHRVLNPLDWRAIQRYSVS